MARGGALVDGTTEAEAERPAPFLACSLVASFPCCLVFAASFCSSLRGPSAGLFGPPALLFALFAVLPSAARVRVAASQAGGEGCAITNDLLEVVSAMGDLGIAVFSVRSSGDLSAPVSLGGGAAADEVVSVVDGLSVEDVPTPGLGEGWTAGGGSEHKRRSVGGMFPDVFEPEEDTWGPNAASPVAGRAGCVFVTLDFENNASLLSVVSDSEVRAFFSTFPSPLVSPMLRLASPV